MNRVSGHRVVAAVVAVAAAAVVGACSEPAQAPVEPQLTIALPLPMTSFNGSMAATDTLANDWVLSLTQQAFYTFDEAGNRIPNEDFGTVELVSESPQVVRYTIRDGVTWSDGAPVDAVDVLLNWAALSGTLNTVRASGIERDPAWSGAIVPDGEVFFDAAASPLEGATLVSVADDKMSLDLQYPQPRADWKWAMPSVGLPAHVVARQSLGTTSTSDGKDAIYRAITEVDADALHSISQAWSADWLVGAGLELPLEDIAVGNGPYAVTDFSAGDRVTLVARDDYEAGPKPSVKRVVIEYENDPALLLGAVQAKGDAVAYLPPNPTVVAALEDVAPEIDSVVAASDIYEHLDLHLDNGGPFDPGTYGGDAAKALAVRKAFLTAVGASAVADAGLAGIESGPGVSGSLTLLPGMAGYDEAVEANAGAALGQGDPEAAAAILAEAGVATPIEVTLLYDAGNPMRGFQYGELSNQVAPAGFVLIDGASRTWGDELMGDDYDAWLFGWQADDSIMRTRQYFASDGELNFTGYANATVDAAYQTLQGDLDGSDAATTYAQIDAQLWADAYGLPLGQVPVVLAYDATVEGIASAPFATPIVWNYWDWRIATE